MLDSLLNNPILFTVIMVAIVVIAVGLILYFLVFKDKIKKYFENRKIEKEKKLAKMEKDKALASEVFANKNTKKKETAPLTKKEQEDINKVLSAVGNKGSALTSKPVKKEQKEAEKLTAEDQEALNKKIASMHGGVAGVGKSQPKKSKPKNTKTDKSDKEENKVSSGGLGFMDQFNKKDKE